MDDLMTWLRAVLDDIEAAARSCAEIFPSPWDVSDRGHTAYVRADEPGFRIVCELEQSDIIDGWLGDRLHHIHRHDPASVLRDVAAKRAIVDLHEHQVFERPDYYSGQTVGCTICHRAHDEDYPGGWCLTVRHLAAVYEDRDGYREEWRPARSEA